MSYFNIKYKNKIIGAENEGDFEINEMIPSVEPNHIARESIP